MSGRVHVKGLIDDEDRREAARILREAVQPTVEDDGFDDDAGQIMWLYRGMDVIDRAAKVAIEAYDGSDMSWGETYELLAALIDRPACVNVHEGREFECSNCGMQWHLLDRENGFEEWAHVRNPKFCPSCGAEVAR